MPYIHGSLGPQLFKPPKAPHTGEAPSPFDALNGPRLASVYAFGHPLYSVRTDELVRPSDGAVTGEIVLDQPTRVGGPMSGRIRLTAAHEITAEQAQFRLVGMRLDEQAVGSHGGSSCVGEIFAAVPFSEPAIPTSLAMGATWEAPFSVDVPTSVAPTAHVGESIIAWALQVVWSGVEGEPAPDSEHWLATHVALAQDPGLIGAGPASGEGLALTPSVEIDNATVLVSSPLPARAGEEVLIAVSWRPASSARGGRIEIERRTNAPHRVDTGSDLVLHGQQGIVAMADLDATAVAQGDAEASLLLPAYSAPTFSGAGLECSYHIILLIDRRGHGDARVERPIGVV